MMTSSVSDKKGRVLVAAIDFGTTFSGYAFSFKDEYETNPGKVSCNLKWDSGNSLLSMKAPTCALFDENKQFHSFGYQAENKYSELALDEEHKNWHFFKKFKMKLHDKKLRRDIEIEDDAGRKMPANLVFGEIIKYLKNHLLQALEQRGTMVNNDTDIHWVLTVPAIWSDSAKQFMREAAYLADIDGGQLTIGLEPEAASLFCQLPPTDQSHISSDAIINAPGSKYMVIDLGGGTADITVHEMQADGGLKELHKPSGGPWGGTKVDEEFNQLLIKIIGAPVLKKFCDDYKSDQLDLERDFETKKRIIAPSSSGKLTLKVPVSLAEIYKEEEGEDVKEAIANSPLKGKIIWMKDKMRIDAEIFKGLFKTCCEEIPAHVKKLLATPGVQGTNIFVMVGGLSESLMIQDAMRKAIPKGKFIIPADAGLAVVKGAVLFGHRPISITSRLARYTYGINISPPFDPSIHPEDHRVEVGGINRCRDVFKRYIQEGDILNVGEVKSGKHITLKCKQREMLLKIYASPDREPMFVDDAEQLGTLVVELPESEEKIRVEVEIKFGETELNVEAKELTEHTKYRAYFDFL